MFSRMGKELVHLHYSSYRNLSSSIHRFSMEVDHHHHTMVVDRPCRVVEGHPVIYYRIHEKREGIDRREGEGSDHDCKEKVGDNLLEHV